MSNLIPQSVTRSLPHSAERGTLSNVARKSRAKTKRRSKAADSAFDLEAIGLVLVALGLFILGVLIPQMPTGAWGDGVRAFFTSRIGVSAYLLPLPPLVLGSLFMIGRNPKGWARVLLGYLLAGFGVWCLLMLAYPVASGGWGLVLRQTLAGAAGLLAYLPALFVLSVGIDLMLGWSPTRLSRGILRRAISGVRHTYKSFMTTRRHLKDRAAFNADVVLAKGDLNRLDKELKALGSLYPGSAEIGSWRKSVTAALRKLKKPTTEKLAEVTHDIRAWQDAVAGFSKDRAKELSVHLRNEGITEFDAFTRRVHASLEDPIDEKTAPGQALDDVRKALALDLTALTTRYGRLTHERDLADASLKGLKPSGLVRVFEAHEARLKAYHAITQDASQLEQDTQHLEPWRDLSGKFYRLDVELDAPELDAYGDKLVKALSSRGRGVLGQVEAWQQALDEAELEARANRPEMVEEDEAFELESDLIPEDIESPETENDFESVPFTDSATVSESVLPEDEDKPLQVGDVPAVGGIPIQLPAFELLESPERSQEDPAALAQEVQARVRKIDETLSNFSLTGRVVASVRGPTVTRFEVEPAPGERISKFANLSDDLALAMAVGSVRIEAPIPGKSVIGLEVPNANRDLIRFREAGETGSFRRAKARLPLILGKSIDGELVVGDLAKMPHLLIAGSTGSGKSVAVNTLIGSLLYKFLPTELRFLMIDPKMVELTPFDGIPHLLQPVVTNPNDAAGVLLGAVAHMERRYKMMSKIGAKNLDQYNEKARVYEMPEMPFVIIIIDELADLMITSPKEVESAIMRLAQMARATGMHLILATQRPSVDILTSLIKVNVPARMAFAVSSGHDSRTILDTMGAERLIGLGDMLYYQPGMVKPARLQGPFIDENEIVNVSSFLRRQYFDDEFVEAYGTDFDPPSLHDSDASGLIDWNDDKLRDAAEIVINEGQGSVSRLQRRLSVGHARAGKLMDSLEALGVVGPHVGSKPREVLVEYEELPNIFGK